MHASLRFGFLDTFKILLDAGAEISGPDKRGFEPCDLILIYNEEHILRYLFEDLGENFKLAEYCKNHFVTSKSLFICIDNNSAECLEILLKKYKIDTYNKKLQIINYEKMLERCIIFKSLNCLKILLNLIPPAQCKITLQILEISIFYITEITDFEFVLGEFIKNMPNSKILYENLLKSCIFYNKLEFTLLILSKFSICSCENKLNNFYDNFYQINFAEIAEIYNIKMLKKRIPIFEKYNPEKLSKFAQNNNILHFAIEFDFSHEIIGKIISQTDVNLFSQRPLDFCTCLIIAAKVFFY